MKNLILFAALPFLCATSFIRCKKSRAASNITLHDKPLSVIQFYIKGKWKLEYTEGGFAAMKFPAKHNSFIQLDANRIIIGNDSAGIFVDAAIVWKRAKDISGDLTYLLTYYYSAGYAFPYAYVVDQVYNDTLVLFDNAYDPLYYYYTKTN